MMRYSLFRPDDRGRLMNDRSLPGFLRPASRTGLRYWLTARVHASDEFACGNLRASVLSSLGHHISPVRYPTSNWWIFRLTLLESVTPVSYTLTFSGFQIIENYHLLASADQCLADLYRREPVDMQMGDQVGMEKKRYESHVLGPSGM